MWLLDGNVLVSLAIDTHEFHERVRRWFDSQSERFRSLRNLKNVNRYKVQEFTSNRIDGRVLYSEIISGAG